MKRILFLSLICIFLSKNLFGQTSLKDDSLKTPADSIHYLSAGSAAWRSLILPGAGQVHQERLWNAAIIYASAATFYYNAAYNFHRYDLTNSKNRLKKAQTDLIIALAVHFYSVADAYIVGRFFPKTGWQGKLLGDNPIKSPWGASLRSAMVPGWGQVYNEKYIKAGAYAGLLTYLGYKIYWDTHQYKKTGLIKFDDDRRRFSWYFGLAYMIMLIDAHVDAYLYKFDKAVKMTIENNVQDQSYKLRIYVPF